jgi:hypothetical protein
MSEQKYDDTNKCSFWKNDRKEEDWHADFRGVLNVEGKLYYADLKKVASENPNAPVLRLSIKPKGEAKNEPVKPLEDSIPF